MGKILFVGNCCLDVITYVQGYPEEDSDLRFLDQTLTLGGNATNSAKVAVQLSGPESALLFSAIPNGNALFENLFKHYRLNTSLCVVRSAEEEDAENGVPMTVCLVNELNGSRTLLSSLGNKRWPNGADLRRHLPSLDGFSWFHFETGFTSKIESVVEMVEYVHSARNKTASNVAEKSKKIISIEFEHPLDEPIMNKFVAFGNLFFISKDFARAQGWTTMHECVTMFQDKYGAHHSTVICPWGEKGVAVKCGTSVPFPCTDNDSTVIELPAHFPSNGRVVDTLAAGDCFVAGTVHFLNAGDGLRQALIKATFLAGESVGQRGLMGLKVPFDDFSI
ncbi:hypothetical protein niasHT_013793 [Heterodera trifolii]|uniref:Carbohydrate kinase PfkB domain-containing protein n=1 Tax=Heterodera trifolii TaxID=157864 RepID=A0ABD2KTG3_9BILA